MTLVALVVESPDSLGTMLVADCSEICSARSSAKITGTGLNEAICNASEILRAMQSRQQLIRDKNRAAATKERRTRTCA